MSQVTVHSPEVFTVADVFSSAECDEWIALSESIGYGDAPITTFLGPVMDKSVRDNERVMLDDVSRAADLWRRVEPHVLTNVRFTAVKPIGVNERLRFYRYDPGQSFKWHRDGYFDRPGVFPRQRSRLTYMVYLNDDFEGGDTTFRGFEIKPAKGMALVFYHQVIHQGAAVTRGRKYVVRTDVMYEDINPGTAD